MAKQILRGPAARNALFSGVEQLSETVTTTLGPKGRNVALDRKWNAPKVIHDGVSVARDIDLPDPFENMGVQLVKEAAEKTNDKAGDGTTTATLLTYAMVKDGLSRIKDQKRLWWSEAGANPMRVKKGIDIATAEVVSELAKASEPVETREQMAQVATISSASKEIGELIAEAMEHVGKDGVITVEEHAGTDIQVEYKEGMQFEKGYESVGFTTNDSADLAEIESPYILITDMQIISAQEIADFLQKFVKEYNRKEIVIISDRVDGAALATLLVNKERGGIIPLAVKAPFIGDRRKETLEDIAVLTGGQVVWKEKDITIDKIDLKVLGRADKVECEANLTRIIGGFGAPAAIKKRAEQIKNKITKEPSDFGKDQLRERLARLTSGVAIIKVGAPTDQEREDRKERVVDAVGATRSAVEEGIIAGGGVALFHIARDLVSLVDEDKDIQAGIRIVWQAMHAPIVKILSNSGEDVSEVLQNIVDVTNRNGSYTYGYNVETQKYGEMFSLGVIDPAKVTRLAVQNAASVASTILTTEALVTNIPDATANS